MSASKLLRRICAASGVIAEAELSLLVSGRRACRRLNFLHRGVDAATDVLSFPQLSPGEHLPAVGPIWLGDLVLCLPVAEAQARRFGRRIEDELAVLLVHGTLHLLGHDHRDAAEARAMAELEMSVLAAIGCEPGQALSGRYFDDDTA